MPIAKTTDSEKLRQTIVTRECNV